MLLHPGLNFSISISEAARLMSFPDEFKLVGQWHQRWKFLGNAVCPFVSQAIGKIVMSQCLDPVAADTADINPVDFTLALPAEEQQLAA